MLEWMTLETLGLWLRPLVWMALGLFLATMLGRMVERFGQGRLTRHQAVLFRRLVFYTVLGIAVALALQQSGFQIGVLLGAAGILTVALGFASQTSASNVISGLFLLAERPFELGHFIEVDGVRGEVVGIDLLSVKLRSLDNLYIRVPNETLIKTRVTNFTRFPVRRLDLPIGVAYGEDLEKVNAVLLALVDENPDCLEEPEPFIYLQQFGASSVDLQLSFWVRGLDLRRVRSDVMFAVKAAFDREGIEIPFPHTSLYAGQHSAPIPVAIHQHQDKP
ncbi:MULTISPECIES: mechanosensitive ion channel family protein [Halomonadaceae]|nr:MULTISPECIES: mechanosensitive ion channel family protein [Halomonas]